MLTATAISNLNYRTSKARKIVTDLIRSEHKDSDLYISGLEMQKALLSASSVTEAVDSVSMFLRCDNEDIRIMAQMVCSELTQR